jgi:hypothetical protein
MVQIYKMGIGFQICKEVLLIRLCSRTSLLRVRRAKEEVRRAKAKGKRAKEEGKRAK